MHVLVFLVSMAMLVGGLAVMGYGFAVPGMEAIVFSVGLLMVVTSVLLPVEFGYRGNHTRG